MRVTLKDIAAKVGITKTAVSQALRGRPGVSHAMRETIRRVAGEMGYVSDPILQRLSAYRLSGVTGQFQGVIAWINHWDQPKQLRGYEEFEQYWCGARLAAKRLGYQLEEFIWPTDRAAKDAEQMLLARDVLGLLLPPHRTDVNWGNFDWSKFSLLRFGMSVRQVDANLVTADHQRAMVMALAKMHEYGYQRIGLVYSAAHDCSMGGNLFGGYRWATRLMGLEETIPPLDLDTPETTETHKKSLANWMKKHGPDAIITAVPQVSVLLNELGIKVPADVAVAGTSINDIPVDAGIDQCSRVIGQIASEMLIKQISLNEKGEPADPCRILIESRWKDGKSLPRRSR